MTRMRILCFNTVMSKLEEKRREAYKQRWYQNYGKYRRYDTTKEIFVIMLEAQGGRCAICRTMDWGPLGPCMDHNHKTHVVRGILCSNCNAGIGCFGDNPETIRAAIKYLEKK